MVGDRVGSYCVNYPAGVCFLLFPSLLPGLGEKRRHVYNLLIAITVPCTKYCTVGLICGGLLEAQGEDAWRRGGGRVRRRLGLAPEEGEG